MALKGQQVVRTKRSFSEFNTDIASSGFLVILTLEIMNVFNDLSDIINSSLSPIFNKLVCHQQTNG
mgnify:CR=1 FL=1